MPYGHASMLLLGEGSEATEPYNKYTADLAKGAKRPSHTAKRLPSVKYSLLQYSKIEHFSKKLHTQKNGPSGTPGPANASPRRAKVSQCRKTERGTLWGFPTSILSQNIKKLKGGKTFIFGKKSHNAKKNCKGDPLGFSNINCDAKQQKN